MIKQGGINELNAIKNIERRSFGKFAYSDSEITEMIRNTDILVYEIDGKYLGYISFFFEIYEGKRSCHIESIGVIPKYRKMGIGSKLMAEYEKICMDKNAEYSILEVRARNYNAIRFYEKLGYRIINIIKNYYSIPYRKSRDAFLMIKDFRS
ncbi:MAG: ribosomal protein S18-alanine N-acetyltransferase [Thermoplasmata archaeon]